jgi:hypothetical protein
MGVGRVFVLAFAADFFADWPAACRCSPGAVPGVAVICYDEGIAEFLDLEGVRPITLRNAWGDRRPIPWHRRYRCFSSTISMVARY